MRSDQIMTRRCAIGLLVVEIPAGVTDDRLKAAKHQLEGELRENYVQASREVLKKLNHLRPYVEYTRAFGCTYHVLLQLESVARGKAIPDALPPVAAMFMAELKNGILTAGHDLDKIRLPLRHKVSDGGEAYTALGGREAACVRGDHMILDQAGVLSSMLRGPDQRTAISGQTARILYTAYAPEGVPEPALRQHLEDIEALLHPDSNASPRFMKLIRAEAADSLLLDVGEA